MTDIDYYYIFVTVLLSCIFIRASIPRFRNWNMQRKIKGYIGEAMVREDRDAAFTEVGDKILRLVDAPGDVTFSLRELAALVNSKKQQFFPGSAPWVPKSLEVRYAHDCTECKPLGLCDMYDLYFCKKSIPTVIARYGHRGGDYTSGLGGKHPALMIAELRAKEKGFI